MRSLKLALLFLVVVCTASSLLGCKSNRVGLIEPYFPQVTPEITDREPILIPTYSQHQEFKEAPPPIPGRLLVKVDEKEVLTQYRLSPPGDVLIRKIRPELAQLPSTFRISDMVELGCTAAGKTLIRLHLEKPLSAEAIRTALEGTPFSLSQAFAATLRAGLNVSTVLVETERKPFADVTSRRVIQKFPQLKSESELHTLFHNLGVHSIRRVFRMAEVPDGRGGYKVEKISDLLKKAKEKYPLRAARGYRDMKLPSNTENWFLLRMSPDADLQKAFSILEQSPKIQRVSYDYPVVSHQEPQDEPEYPIQWALKSSDNWGIDVAPAWDVTAGNERVTVAVIGSGIKEDLDELSGRIWINPGEVPGDGIDNDGNGYVDDITGITTDDTAASPTSPVVASDHETKVAAIIAADVNNNLITGVVGKADVALMNISIGYGLGCTELAEAIMYAACNGADIVNMSLGAPPHWTVWEAIQYALTRDGGGAALIASAGNKNRQVTQSYSEYGAQYPAWYSGVIAVGGIDGNGHRWFVDSNVGSNYGTGLDLVAPADNVTTISFSTMDQTVAELSSLTGTSASAAIVSGVTALVIGKYPTVRLEQLTPWLRATATDILDPLGMGDNMVGDDMYTGAGLVSANASITQGDPDPIIVDILVEKIGGIFSGYVANAVSGRPDLGITVQGPLVGQWELHYGLSDSPESWNRITGADNTLLVPRETNIHGFIDVADGYEYLNTDDLANRQVYTIRLKATDALGRTYTAYDWFMPLKAMIMTPAKNTPIPTRWGWPQIAGVVDTRDGATYDISVLTPGGLVNPNWQLQQQELQGVWLNRGSNYGCLVASEPDGSYPVFGASPSGQGWHQIRLEVHSPDGRTTVDTQDIYIDNTAFPVRPDWPVEVPFNDMVLWTNWYPKGVQAVDVDGTGSYRIFIQQHKHFMCLTTAGIPLWDLPLALRQEFYDENVADPPAFLIDDLDGNNEKEILVAGLQPKSGNPQELELAVYLLKANETTITPFNDNWPMTFPNYSPPNSINFDPFGNLHAGDIDGNGVKEVIFYQRPFRWEMVSEEERGIGRLHVVDLNGQPLTAEWPVTLTLDSAALQIGDIDSDGKDEILLEESKFVYEDNGQLKPGWPPVDAIDSFRGGARLVQLDSDSDLEILEYGTTFEGGELKHFLDVRKQDGTRFAGNWPVYLDSAIYRYATQYYKRNSQTYTKVAQVVSGGSPEIIVAYDWVKVLNTDGSPVLSIPPIELDGQCLGLDLLDVDYDNQLEFVVLVSHFENDEGWKVQAYSNLVAYDLDGTPLSDDLWPIRVAWGWDHALGNTVSIEDIDGDGQLEVINSMDRGPYYAYVFVGMGSELYDGVIEVLNIRYP